MIIRNTLSSDLDAVMEIYSQAREFMRKSGNPTQWGEAYPSRELIESDIASGFAYVVENNGEVVAAFFFRIGTDPTYLRIYGGEWLDDSTYGVIHRIAVKYRGRGIITEVFDYCSTLCKSIRIDTHADNIPMQKALAKHGFIRCGIIYLVNGDERIAYQRIS